MKQFYTYLHCKPDGTPFYVGKGNSDRAYRLDGSRKNQHHKNIVAKHGKENILVYIFPCESEQQAFADEIKQIAQLRREGYELCNMTDGGEGLSGYICSDETKIKLSIANKGKQSCLGHTQSRETIEKRMLKIRGKERKKGYKQTAEHIAKGVASRIGKKRKPFSKEHLESLSKASRKRWDKIANAACKKCGSTERYPNRHCKPCSLLFFNKHKVAQQELGVQLSANPKQNT